MKRVCVFAGSSPGNGPHYRQAAHRLGSMLVERGYSLVYGGAHVGLMGAVADAVLGARGQVIGVIPRALVDREVAHQGMTDLQIVESMHERKGRIAARTPRQAARSAQHGGLLRRASSVSRPRRHRTLLFDEAPLDDACRRRASPITGTA